MRVTPSGEFRTRILYAVVREDGSVHTNAAYGFDWRWENRVVGWHLGTPNNPDVSEFPERWVRIMCDYSADPVWQKGGANAELDALPVSRPLRAALRIWAERFERENPSNSDDFPDVSGFSIAGHFLARRVKQELPGWTVIYHDEEAARASRRHPNPSRDSFEYEVTL